MKHLYLVFFLAITILGNNVNAQTPVDYSIQLIATTQVSPPQIKVQWKKITGITSYTVFKKKKNDPSFGAPIATLNATDSFYLDNSVVVDSTYEYQVFGGSTASGYMYAAIKAIPIHERGTLILLVDSTFSDSCKNEIAQLIKDIRGDGWKVLQKTFLRTETVTNVKNYIVSAYNADNTVKSILILGHIAVPYSGNLNPDAHTDHQGAWPADVFYADVNGTWSDNSVNNTVASRTQNDNIPGDGKYDQSVLPSNAELQISRIDFANMPAFAKTEVQMMKSYLNRDHLYKMDSLTMLHRGLIDDNFGISTGEPFAANGWRNFSPLLGHNNTQSIDYITSLNGGTYQWSYGCGGGSYTSAGGVGTTANIASNNINGIFTVLFGSYFGDWDATDNFLRAPLCANIPALTNCWAGRPHWFFHHMALGENIGYSTLLAQNNTASLYQASNNYGSGMVHIALMGDLTLRTDYIKPVSNVGLMAIAGAGAKVTWSSSPDPAVVGYYVYRSADEYGTYKKRSGLITGTNFTDSFGTTGQYYYMVRAAKLQNTPSGGYYNLSLGVVSAPATIVYPKPDLGITVETPSESTVTIYPNPAHDKLNIVINSGTTTMATIQITDQMGRLLITKTTSLHTGDNTITSDISMFPQGVYYVSVAYNDVMKTVKWVKY